MRLAVLICCTFAGLGSASAGKRLALLVGNQGYSSEIGALANPHNDVALIAKALAGLGFEVAVVREAGLADLHEAVNAYVRRLRDAGPGAVGFFYYAGHGASDGTIGYLIPVDVKSAEEGKLWDRSLRVTEITRKLKAEAGSATHFVVLDACRNALKLRKAGSRALVESRGLMRVAEEAGMLIAYATAEGELASDAGAYARVLAEEIVRPGVEAVTMFRTVQRRVRAAIRQEPHLQFSALGDVYLAGLAPGKGSDPAGLTPAHPAPVLPPAAMAAADLAWASVKDSDDIATLELFRQLHGKERPLYDHLAALKIEALEGKRLAALQAEKERERLEALAKLDPARGVKPGSGESFHDRTADGRPCPECPEMVVVPSGSFTMGSPPGEESREADEGPQRRVTIARPFAVGRFEVTFAEWDACRTEGECIHWPEDRGWGRGKRPVINVSWDDITQQYLPWLSRKTGKTYRLLTEAEWEYAARAGTSTPFWWGSSMSPSQANYHGNYTYGGGPKGEYRGKTVPVDSFAPNPWGLYNVHGNVWEWVQDCWNGSYNGAPSDGTAWTTRECGRRVLRGGSWYVDPRILRAAYRYGRTTDYRDSDLGFRVGRMLSP